MKCLIRCQIRGARQICFDSWVIIFREYMFSVFCFHCLSECVADPLIKKSLSNAAYLVDEHLCTARAHEQHSPSQGVPVPVELLSAHRVKEVSKDSADVAVHPLQGHIQTQPRRLVHKGLQTPNIWRWKNDTEWVMGGDKTQTDRGRKIITL